MAYVSALAAFAVLTLLILRDRTRVGSDNAHGLIAAFFSLVPFAFAKASIREQPADEMALLVATAHVLCVVATLGRPALFVYAAKPELDRSHLTRSEIALVKCAPWTFCVLVVGMVWVT